MLPSNVSQSRCSPNLYYPVPVFPSTHVSHIPQFLCFPFPMFPSPCATQSICFPVPIDVHQSLCSPVSYVPQLIHQSLCSPLLFHRSIFHSPYSPNILPSSLCSPVPMFPKHVRSLVPMLPQLVHQFLCSPVLLHKCFPFLMFPKHVSQSLCSPGTGEHRNTGTGELHEAGEHRDWGTCLGNIRNGKYFCGIGWEHCDWWTSWRNKGTGEQRDCGR